PKWKFPQKTKKCMVTVQEYIDQTYPTKEERRKITFLNLEGKDLEGILDLSEFTSLEKLNCSRNELTNLEVSKCEKLTDFNCCYNLLDDLDFLKKLPNPKKLIF